MLIFKDIITGDEMFADTFKYELLYDDCIIKAQSRYTKKEEVGNIDIGCGDAFGKGEEDDGADGQGGDEPAEKVLDIIYNANLTEIKMSSKEFMAYIKDYLKKTVTYLEENGKSDRVPAYKKGVTEFIKFIKPKLDDCEFYTGTNGENEDGEVVGGLAISYWEADDAPGPVVYFFKDALKEEKC